MNKSIFIDFDGVFHPVGQSVPLRWEQVDIGYRFFHEKITKPFVTYCKRHNVDLIVSSAWRLDFTIDNFNEIFEGRVVGVTPSDTATIPGKPNRWGDIQCYLAENPKIQKFAVLDDQAKLFPGSQPEVVLTNGTTGLVAEDLIALHRILNKPL